MAFGLRIGPTVQALTELQAVDDVMIANLKMRFPERKWRGGGGGGGGRGRWDCAAASLYIGNDYCVHLIQEFLRRPEHARGECTG